LKIWIGKNNNKKGVLMQKVAIVTDDFASIPEELSRELKIRCVFMFILEVALFGISLI